MATLDQWMAEDRKNRKVLLSETSMDVTIPFVAKALQRIDGTTYVVHVECGSTMLNALSNLAYVFPQAYPDFLERMGEGG